MEFSRKKYWSGLSFPSPGDLANPGIEPRSPVLQADSLLTEPLGSYKQGKKTTLRMGENSKWNNWQRTNLQNIQAPHEAQYQKSKQPNQPHQKVGRRLKQTFSKEDIQMANKHMKRCTTSTIKTTVRYRTPIRKSTNNKCWRRCGEKGKSLLHCLWECKLIQPLLKN